MKKTSLFFHLLSFLCMVLISPAHALSLGDIVTIAGGGTGYNGPATSLSLRDPSRIAIDNAGNIYITDTANHIIRKVNAATGISTTVAGNGIQGFSGDNGPATAASLSFPAGVTVDSAGNIYVADESNNRIRKISAATGVITTVAGSGTVGFSGDNGAATAASLSSPAGVAVDSAGNIYIADTYNSRIRKVTAATGIISTVAGNGSYNIFADFHGDDGPATAAELDGPNGVTLDSAGNIYIADLSANQIRKVNASTGIITTIAGNGSFESGGDNGPATAAGISGPYDVSVDSAGNVYIAETYEYHIRKVNAATGIITTVAGDGTYGFSGDNVPAIETGLACPSGVIVDNAGNLYIADSENYRIRKVSAATGIITTVAGNGTPTFSGDNGPASAASLAPGDVRMDSAGNLYIADMENNRIYEINASGIITSVAGYMSMEFSGDNGPATAAGLYNPTSVTVDSVGNIYIADQFNNRIRKVSSATGIITTVAGNGTGGFSGDNGPATAASLNEPSGVTVDGVGNIYIADKSNHRIRKVSSATGIITTVAGNGTGDFSGDNGPATAAGLRYPNGVTLDSSGNIYIADTHNQSIRKIISATGIITTVAGTGGTWYGSFSGDNGPATAANLSYPTSVTVDSVGNIYIADKSNHRIRKVSSATGIITTVAGNGTGGFSGDNGPATAASLSVPTGITVDSDGNLYIADSGNNRIRKLISTVPTSYPLDVTISGSGTVTSTPVGIACQSGSAAGCSAPLSPGTQVTLLPTPSANASFAGWSGACTGSGSCQVTMNSAQSITATFPPNPATVKISGNSTRYYAIDPALDAATLSDTVVSTRNEVFAENVIMTSPVSIRLLGGFTDADFKARTGTSYTTIDGSLKVRSGTLRVERINVR